MKIVLITGCSSGIGLALAKELSKKHKVFATLRKDNNQLIENKNLTKIFLDVKKDKQIKKAIKKIICKEKHIDCIINNAAYALIGPLESLQISEIKDQFDTNLFGPIRLIKEVLPIMKKQSKGTIINISSIAGIIGSNNMSIYCSSKFALEGLSESLFEELKNFNIKIKLIEFGYVKNTSFGKNSIKKTLSKYRKDSSQKQRKETKIKDVIKIVEKAMSDNSNQLRYVPDSYTKNRISEKLKNLKETNYLL